MNLGLILVLDLGALTQPPWLPLPWNFFCSCFTFFLELLLSRNSEPSYLKELNFSCHFEDSPGFIFVHFYIAILYPRSLLKQRKVQRGLCTFSIDHDLEDTEHFLPGRDPDTCSSTVLAHSLPMYDFKKALIEKLFLSY